MKQFQNCTKLKSTCTGKKDCQTIVDQVKHMDCDTIILNRKSLFKMNQSINDMIISNCVEKVWNLYKFTAKLLHNFFVCLLKT